MRERRNRYGSVDEDARADHDVGARQEHGLETLDLADRRGAVGVGEQSVGATRGEHPRAHRHALPAVAGKPQEPD